jgi:hydrogenase maturation protease
VSRVVVLGVGNVLLSDEGLGVRAVERLEREFLFPENVVLLDGGTLGLGLIHYLEDAEKVLVIDAVSGGGPPGRVYKFAGHEVTLRVGRKVSMHDLGLQEVLALLSLMDRSPEEIVVVGMEPGDLSPGVSLSPQVERGMDLLIKEVLRQLRSWGVEPVRRCARC